jgi:tRNA uridine 5-carboxymethylaminomethyl modification enzyme
MARLKEKTLRPEAGVQDRLKGLGTAPIKNRTSLEQLLRRNEIFFEHLSLFDPALAETDVRVAEEAETRIKYAGYIERQERQVLKLKRMEEVRLPEDTDYGSVHGLTAEVREKLGRIRPLSLGQASRISGVTPAALMALQVHLKRIGSYPA